MFAEGSFMQVEPPEDDRARGAQPAHCSRVLVGDEIAVGGRAEGRGSPAGMEKVLDCDRHAMQRPAIAAGAYLHFRLLRFGERAAVRHRQIGVQRRVDRGDAVHHVSGNLDRGEFAVLDQNCDLDEACIVQRIQVHRFASRQGAGLTRRPPRPRRGLDALDRPSSGRMVRRRRSAVSTA